MFSVSVIIPVYNEQAIVLPQLQKIKERCGDENTEIIVVDGGSTDKTLIEVKKAGVNWCISPGRGRALQMNFGAKNAKGNVLYFLHIDTLPPKNFDLIILKSIHKGNTCGCFRMKFDSESKFLSFWAYFTRFNYYICRGGDQSMFITKSLFWQLGGFDTSKLIAEDMDFLKKIYRYKHSFTILPFTVVTSARKYEQVGKWRLQYIFARIHFMLLLGFSQQEIIAFYQQKIKQV
jgi:hypothetical protein